MKLNLFIKSMLAGMAFPAIFLPLAYSAIYLYEPNTLQSTHFQFIPMYIPIFFGLTNALLIGSRSICPMKKGNCCYWVFGGTLGLLVAVFAVFVLEAPEVLFGFTHGVEFFPIIALPIIYGLIFRFIVRWLNQLLAIID